MNPIANVNASAERSAIGGTSLWIFVQVFHESRYCWIMGSQCLGLLTLKQRSGWELWVQDSEEMGWSPSPWELRTWAHTSSCIDSLFFQDREPNWSLAGDGGLEMDMLSDLQSMQFEYGIEEEDRCWLYLQGRYQGRMIEACAHATFLCKILHNLR